MTIPTSAAWDLLDLNASNMTTFTTLLSAPSEASFTNPGNFTLVSTGTSARLLSITSTGGDLSEADFVGITVPPLFTIDFVGDFRYLPEASADPSRSRVGFTIGSAGSEGFSIFLQQGVVSIGSSLSDYVTPTHSPVELVSAGYVTPYGATEVAPAPIWVRIAVDLGVKKAYVFLGRKGDLYPVLVNTYDLPVSRRMLTASSFKLFVKDEEFGSEVRFHSIRLATGLVVPSAPPVADAGRDKASYLGTSVRLDGRASSDVDNPDLVYRWRLIDAPVGSDYVFEDTCTAVDDDDGDGLTDTVQYDSLTFPTVSAGDVLFVSFEDELFAENILSVDTNNKTITIERDILPLSINAPYKILFQSALVDADTPTPYLVPDVVGTYKVDLTVFDGVSYSERSSATIAVSTARTPVGEEPDVSSIWKYIGDEWVYIENRGVFEEVWKGTAQILAGKMLEAWQYHYNLSIKDAQPTFQRKWVAYRTLVKESSPSTVKVAPRYGILYGSKKISAWTGTDIGETLEFEVATGPNETTTYEFTIPDYTGSSWYKEVYTSLAATTGLAGVVVPVVYASNTPLFSEVLEVLFNGSLMASLGYDTHTDVVELNAPPPAWALAAGIGGLVVTYGGKSYVATAYDAGGSPYGLDCLILELPTGEVGIPISLGLTVDMVVAGAEYVGFTTSSVDNTTYNPAAYRITGGTAASIYGLTTDKWNNLDGTQGLRVDAFCYRVDPGTCLLNHTGRVTMSVYTTITRSSTGTTISRVGEGEYDLLVTNNGQSFRIAKIDSSPDDYTGTQRVYTLDPLPPDVSSDWCIPSRLVSTGSSSVDAVNYEKELVYPGDLVEAEHFDPVTGTTTDVYAWVVAQKASTVGFINYGTRHIGGCPGLGIVDAPEDDTEDPSLLIIGVRRRKAMAAQEDLISVPMLQDKIPYTAAPTAYKENEDFIVEPMYRDLDGSPVPAVQWRDSIWIDTDSIPEDIYWSEVSIFSNLGNIEALYGKLVDFTRDNAEAFGSNFDYLAAVAGLLFSYQRGPSPYAIKVGTSILIGQSFAEVKGTIVDIEPNYSAKLCRILIKDYLDTDDAAVADEVVRTYYLRKPSADSLYQDYIATSPVTGVTYTEGDVVEQFAPLGTGVSVLDLKNSPRWFVPYVRAGTINELEKYHTFVVRFNLDTVKIENINLIARFIERMKPNHTKAIVEGLLGVSDEVYSSDLSPVGYPKLPELLPASLFNLDLTVTVGAPYVIQAGDAYLRSRFADTDGKVRLWDTISEVAVEAAVGDTLPASTYEIEVWDRYVDWAGGTVTAGTDKADCLLNAYENRVMDLVGTYAGTAGAVFVVKSGMTLPPGVYRPLGRAS